MVIDTWLLTTNPATCLGVWPLLTLVLDTLSKCWGAKLTPLSGVCCCNMVYLSDCNYNRPNHFAESQRSKRASKSKYSLGNPPKSTKLDMSCVIPQPPSINPKQPSLSKQPDASQPLRGSPQRRLRARYSIEAAEGRAGLACDTPRRCWGPSGCLDRWEVMTDRNGVADGWWNYGFITTTAK